MEQIPQPGKHQEEQNSKFNNGTSHVDKGAASGKNVVPAALDDTTQKENDKKGSPVIPLGKDETIGIP